MKKLTVLSAILLLIGISCKKDAREVINNLKEPETQTKPVCGMEEAMARLSPEMRGAMQREAIQDQAAELLLFLDFDGAAIRRGFPNPTGSVSAIIGVFQANCPPPSLTDQQKQEIIELVKDDFSPFNIVVTTDQAIFDAYLPFRNKQICIITSTPAVAGFPSGIGGISPFTFLGNRLPYDPCFAFANLYGGNVKAIAAVISHEVGHTIGLGHQHLFNDECGFVREYHPGFGTGLLSFAPIMGDAGFNRIDNWYAQSCHSPTFGQPQDDFELLNSQVVLKADDFPNSPEGNNTVDSGPIAGILEAQNDADYILINFKNPGPVTITSNNIDIKASLYNPGGHLVEEYNDPADISVTIPSANGKKYLKIEGAGNVNMASRFMTGKYTVSF